MVRADADVGSTLRQLARDDALTAGEITDSLARYFAYEIEDHRDGEIVKGTKGRATEGLVVPVGDLVVGRPAHGARSGGSRTVPTTGFVCIVAPNANSA